MRLPDTFLDELLSRTSIAQVAGRKVQWDMRKSNQAKGDFWAPCPFHQEKTASFHVDDQKGFYYCFGCHQKGNALTFVRETENLDFMGAVRLLAEEAGMPLPAPDPKAQERQDRRSQLAEVMETAVRYFRLMLQRNEGEAARKYLETRGLTDETCKRFEIGFAPNNRAGLVQALKGKGISEADLEACGLVIRPDDGGTPFDRFRGRIMFPIRDARNKVIAFGGRAMDPNARAKYLNSPETILFDKSRTLYNLGHARAAAGKTGGLIVAEGYMDVIALAQAGFEHAVAPLGTAITEHQLQMLWRIHAEPTLALDGDKAGLNAALRLIDLALPLLGPDRSLRFAILPEGQDPDDLIKGSGPSAMQAQIDDALPAVDLLWNRETDGHTFDSPERRAALDARLREILGRLQDKNLRRHYADAILEKRNLLFGKTQNLQTGTNQNSGKAWSPRRTKPTPLPGTKSSLLARKSLAENETARLREAVMLYAALLNPAAVRKRESDFEKCRMANADLSDLRLAILDALSEEDLPPTEALVAQCEARLNFDPFELLRRVAQVRSHPLLKDSVDPELIAQVFFEELDKQLAEYGAAQELHDAVADMETLPDEGLTWRIRQATEEKEKAKRSKTPETDSAGDSRAEMLDKLDEVLQGIPKKRQK